MEKPSIQEDPNECLSPVEAKDTASSSLLWFEIHHFLLRKLTNFRLGHGFKFAKCQSLSEAKGKIWGSHGLPNLQTLKAMLCLDLLS